MASALLAAIGVLLLLFLAYIGGLIYVRRIGGERYQNLYNAIGQAALAIAFDFVVLYFSISFCTAGLKYALRMRSGGSANQVLDSMMQSFGGKGLDNPTIFGLIIPAVSWIVAHVVIVGLMLTIRYIYTAMHARTPQAVADGAVASFVWLQAGVAGALSATFGYFFRWVVGFDALLLRYQIISQSRVLKDLLGSGWEARLSQDELVQKLGHTFIGQIVIHAGAFYVITLLVAAFVMVVAMHNLFSAIQRLPRGRAYQVTAPVLTPIAPDDRDYGLRDATAAQPPATDQPRPPDPPTDPDPPPGDGPTVLDLPPAE